MATTSTVRGKIAAGLLLLLAMVALPLTGGATVAAVESESAGGQINVIIQNDGIGLILKIVNGKESTSHVYTTTEFKAMVLFEARGVGEIKITNKAGEVISAFDGESSYNKIREEAENITAVFDISDVPGEYEYVLSMKDEDDYLVEIPFRIILEAAKVIPEIPGVPELPLPGPDVPTDPTPGTPNPPNTGYTKLFGHIVTKKALSSLIFMVTVAAGVVLCLLIVLARRPMKKTESSGHKSTRTGHRK
jgi:hypothetical protein